MIKIDMSTEQQLELAIDALEKISRWKGEYEKLFPWYPVRVATSTLARLQQQQTNERESRCWRMPDPST